MLKNPKLHNRDRQFPNTLLVSIYDVPILEVDSPPVPIHQQPFYVEIALIIEEAKLVLRNTHDVHIPIAGKSYSIGEENLIWLYKNKEFDGVFIVQNSELLVTHATTSTSIN